MNCNRRHYNWHYLNVCSKKDTPNETDPYLSALNQKAHSYGKHSIKKRRKTGAFSVKIV